LEACIERALPYSVIPGASAVLTALVGSGFSTERFCFCGFLPVKSGQRERELSEASQRSETTVFFESPHRLLKTLEAATRLLPERLLCVARELTKQFEEYRRGTPAELLAHYTATPPRGEIVLLVAGRTAKESRALAREHRKNERHQSRLAKGEARKQVSEESEQD